MAGRARVLALSGLRLIAPWIAVVVLTALAAAERVRTGWRRARGSQARLIWGPIPIISLKYWSEAMRSRGYESTTAVSHHFDLHRREDFDVYRDDLLGPSGIAEVVRDYAFFAWALRRGDVFARFFNGGFLLNTPLDRLELPLLRLAGKKVVVSPYGSDIAVAGHLGYLEEPLFADYPNLRETSEAIRKRVLHTARWADLIIRNWQFGFLPRYDVTWLTQLAIDTAAWDTDGGAASGSTGEDESVVIVHAPNHRNVKGTHHLEQAVHELREQGLRVDLRIVEHVPNEELGGILRDADIIGDQFLAGYAMSAIEGMALGKPVLTNLASLPPDIRASEVVAELPLVDTRPETLGEQIRSLVEEPERRAAIGRAGRDFVMRHHSYEAVAPGWETIVSHLWRGTHLPADLSSEAVSPTAER